MKLSRSDLMRQILLTLDRSPSSIYDLIYSIDKFSDPKRTRLPKLLKTMEKENLVVSALQPGPLGPYRRIYQPGPEAEEYLVETLRGGFETLLHFYNQYRKANPGNLYNFGKAPSHSALSGKILYMAYPTITVDDIDEIRELVTMNNISLYISGSDTMLNKTGISYSAIDEENMELQVDDETFSEIRLRGIPSHIELIKTISECKRILVKNGLLRIKIPYVFFEEPKKASLAEFIRITAETLFPDLGFVEGADLKRIIENEFIKNGLFETNLGEVVFWGLK
ncbi:PadR family transcriptional regulator [Candidatus Thorarchaeota archaeon]|nr:MAG: PadR family transcriptional regulator [Candidatus Thorarchaeota archaeon]